MEQIVSLSSLGSRLYVTIENLVGAGFKPAPTPFPKKTALKEDVAQDGTNQAKNNRAEKCSPKILYDKAGNEG
jgi:hypothetical protein